MKAFKIVLGVIVLIIISIIILIKNINNYQDDGTILLKGIDKTVKVVRDNNGMAYIYGENLKDALYAQGFITAQDRLFQMDLLRRFAKGELSELAGDKALAIDKQNRTIGFYRNAKKHAEILNETNKNYLQAYVNGINDYIARGENHHFEFTLSGIEPKPWTIADCLALFYYMGWKSAANLKAEIIAQMITEKLGPEKAKEFIPISTSIDGPNSTAALNSKKDIAINTGISFLEDEMINSFLSSEQDLLNVGSNNWVVSSSMSKSGKPIIVNDPHLQTDIIPGPWYSTGIITPTLRFVGATVPGIPGMVIGRNEYVALGTTNSYHDAQDLYIETVDPKDDNYYLEGTKRLPFIVIKEPITVKDKDNSKGYRTETITIRLTKRGPIISEAMPMLKTKKVISVRWSPFETMSPTVGLFEILEAENVQQLKEGLSKITAVMLNFVYGDKEGNIGWFTTGKIPKRSQRDGSVPFTVKDSRDNWVGWIPTNEMPQKLNPKEGWIATSNNRMVSDKYPYFLSSYFSPHYRYTRIKELLTSNKGKITVDDHWRFMRDDKNIMAENVAPVMAKILLSYGDTKKLGEILSQWNYFDDKDKAAPLIFQAVYLRFAYHTFKDELGEDLAKSMLNVWYIWKERMEKMVIEGSSPWFDDVTTKEKESMGKLFHISAQEVLKDYGEKLGSDPESWKWGDEHKITFVSPIMRKGILKGLFGGGSHPMSGSEDTVYRAKYKYKKLFDVYTTASLRVVFDLADDDKITAVLPGGVGGRVFEDSTTNQIDAFMGGEKLYWWFSDNEIDKHTENILFLKKK